VTLNVDLAELGRAFERERVNAGDKLPRREQFCRQRAQKANRAGRL
jgi:hypothetical protein